MENNINTNNDNSFEIKNGNLDNAQPISQPKKRIIKTYRDFAVKALDNNPTSLANMIIQEKNKQKMQSEQSAKNPKNLAMIISSIILVILGIIAVASIVIFIYTKNKSDEEKQISTDNLVCSIDYDYKKIIDFSTLSDVKSASDDTFDNTNLPFGTIKMFFLQKR
ncbi:hypothetical protein LDC_1570 [sediment metagenome]|uniref:Uncharacterized protein n=1 Tax=sediment metagenome TaxID=749907 RepID=D9PJ61_9ZZZZ